MQALIVSNILLWLMLIACAFVLLGLIRQIGLLHQRIAPAGALMLDKGVEVGQPAPHITVADRSGRPVNIGYTAEQATLLFFLSPTCPVCKALLPAVKSISQSQPELKVIYVSDGEAALHEQFVSTAGLESACYLVSPEVGMTFQVGKLPYAILLDRTGTLQAKGLVNSREHLDSLFETELLGSSTLQSHLQKHTEAMSLHTSSTST